MVISLYFPSFFFQMFPYFSHIFMLRSQIVHIFPIISLLLMVTYGNFTETFIGFPWFSWLLAEALQREAPGYLQSRLPQEPQNFGGGRPGQRAIEMAVLCRDSDLENLENGQGEFGEKDKEHIWTVFCSYRVSTKCWVCFVGMCYNWLFSVNLTLSDTEGFKGWFLWRFKMSLSLTIPAVPAAGYLLVMSWILDALW